MNKTKNAESKGITLIALIITIIIMLILVTVSITMAVKGGLFKYASDAGKKTNEAIQDEQKFATLEEGLSVDQLIAKFTSVHKWTRNGDTVTCSHCNTSYNLGDPISYTPDEVTSPYVLTAEKSGIKDAITNDGRDESEFSTTLLKDNYDQEINQEDATWIVLGIEDADGDGTYESLLITTKRPVNCNENFDNFIYFYGKNGAFNSVNELNNMCRKLYSSKKYGVARSMTVEDVIPFLVLDSTVNASKKVKDLATFENIITKGTYTPDGKNTKETLGEYVSILWLDASLLSDQEPWTSHVCFLGWETSAYWLATDYVSVQFSSIVHFGPGSIEDDGHVYPYNYLFSSAGGEECRGFGLRPVVSLRSDIPT